jgi:hypothetical protein
MIKTNFPDRKNFVLWKTMATCKSVLSVCKTNLLNGSRLPLHLKKRWIAVNDTWGYLQTFSFEISRSKTLFVTIIDMINHLSGHFFSLPFKTFLLRPIFEDRTGHQVFGLDGKTSFFRQEENSGLPDLFWHNKPKRGKIYQITKWP